MAWATLKERGAMKIDAKADARSAWQIIVDGILLNLLNPKLSIFFVAFLPQFISPTEPHALLRMLELSGVFMAATFVIFALYGLFAASMRDKVLGSKTAMDWMRRTFAAAFVALGARLALQEK
jgi:threonine/homoserine/homoserine lactone efflux protein